MVTKRSLFSTIHCSLTSFIRKIRHAHFKETRGYIVEYALILVLVAVVVIVILALLGPAIGNVFSNIVNNI